MSSHGAQQAGRLTVAAFRRDLEGVRLAHVAEKGGALFALLDADEPYPVGTSSLLARIAGLPDPRRWSALDHMRTRRPSRLTNGM